MKRRLAVVGGGIAGLAAAWQLRGSDDAAEVVLYEASDRLGGKIRTGEVAGTRVELGPDAFLARVPYGVELCRELGLRDELVSPAAGHALVWTRGRLRKLPGGLVLGVPSDLKAVARSGTISARGLARAALDLVLPATPSGGDRTVGQIVRARMGAEVLARLVDPLVGGINAGRSDLLSAAAVAPQLDAAARSGRSLLLSLKKQAATARAAAATVTGQPSPPVFFTHPLGLGRMVDELSDRLRSAGVELRTGSDVSGLRRGPDGWLLSIDGSPGSPPEEQLVDGVILAVPAPAAVRLLGDVSPAAAAELSSIEHSSVVVTTFVYSESALARPLDGTGFLVPRPEGRLMTAATFMSVKWPHVSLPGSTFIRVSCGRHGDHRPGRLDDDELARALHRELAEALGLRGEPQEVNLTRWPDAFPQYAAGHLDKADRVDAAVAGLAGLAVAGAAYRGVGIPACINSGRQAAHRVLTSLSPAPTG